MYKRQLYELAITNTKPTPVTIDRFEVRSTDPPDTIVAYEGAVLASRLRRIDGSTLTDPVLAPGEQLFLFVDVAVVAAITLPLSVSHRVTIGGKEFNLAAMNIDATQAPSIASPVNGKNWVVTGGCCGPESPSRTTVYTTETGYSVAGRYAMDLSEMDPQGRFVIDDPSVLTSYPSYGQYVNAVASGRVVGVVDGLTDQVPGVPPDPGSFDEDTAQGNAVVLELGSGQYAYYGALKPGSIIVKPGTNVRKGQPIAQIGNSGDSASPHLHFEVLSAPDRIGAEGLPFVLTTFGYSGHIDRARLFERGLAGPYADSRLPVTQVRSAQLPLDLSILDFESSSGSSGNPLL